MKLKLDMDDAFLLEDALLDLYYGLPTEEHEGNPDLSRIINRLQDKMWKED